MLMQYNTITKCGLKMTRLQSAADIFFTPYIFDYTVFSHCVSMCVCVCVWIGSAIMGCCCPLHREFVRGAVVCCVCVEEVHEKEGQGQRKGQEKGKREEQRRL